MQRTWADILWGKNAKIGYLLVAAILMLLAFLGCREIWTQEHRWADIVYAMFYYHDYLHPTLDGVDYYDKPLLSYWLIVGIATFIGKLTTFAMRLPSALAGILAVWSIYSLGKTLRDRQFGLMAGWMLLTTFYFVFWSRTSSADMLNMAGTLCAVSWYFSRKANTRFMDYAIFFVIMAVTALCKGLIGPVITVLAILPDLLMKQEWKRHLKFSIMLSAIPALILYVLPFWLSSHFSNSQYGENGLTLVYRENILRYFQPFDHKGPLYTYFVFLPVYLLPWTFFFIPALFSLKSRWKKMTTNSKWMVLSVALIFVFLTVSGSRRNYYVLPLVPFAILMTADWILAGLDTFKRNVWAGRVALIFFLALFVDFDVAQPLYYSSSSMTDFATEIQQRTGDTKKWNYVMLDPESKVRFYLDIAPDVKNYAIAGNLRPTETADTLLHTWPFLQDANKKTDTIYVSRKQYEAALKQILTQYDVIETPPGLARHLIKKDVNMPIAFVPKSTEK